MTALPRAVLAMDEAAARRLFDDDGFAALRSLAQVRLWSGSAADAEAAGLAEADVLVTTWGSPAVDEALLREAPRLRAVFHGAGTVKALIGDACWERGIVVVSAATANAVPVAEFTLASVLYAGKRVPDVAHRFTASRGDSWRSRMSEQMPTNYRRVVGVVGLSRIGLRVAELLRPFDLEVVASDPYATERDAAAVGARLVDLGELLRRSDTVSLHAPLLPETRGMIGAPELATMRDGATLINTARGGLVDTEALTAELVSGRLHAMLDVTEPEPLPSDSPLYDLPNVQLTPHVAGSLGAEIQRMGALIVDELDRYLSDRPLRHRIRREDLSRVA